MISMEVQCTLTALLLVLVDGLWHGELRQYVHHVDGVRLRSRQGLAAAHVPQHVADLVQPRQMIRQRPQLGPEGRVRPRQQQRLHNLNTIIEASLVESRPAQVIGQILRGSSI